MNFYKPCVPTLTAIVAHDPNRLIGAAGTLPWHLPADLAFFKKRTQGHAIVMGRKTFESIGRPLPKRQNIVLTRDPTWHAEGVATLTSLHDLSTLSCLPGPIFIIGGSQIYEATLPLLDDILITHVKKTHQGDTWFPEYAHLFRHSEILDETADFIIKRHWA